MKKTKEIASETIKLLENKITNNSVKKMLFEHKLLKPHKEMSREDAKYSRDNRMVW